MNTNPVEILLARLFASCQEVEQFLQDREGYARRCGLQDGQLAEISRIDAAALRFAARSYERKRQQANVPAALLDPPPRSLP